MALLAELDTVDVEYGGYITVDGVTYGPDEVPPRCKGRRKPWRREELLDRIARWANMYGSPPSKRAWNITKLRGRLYILKKEAIRLVLAIQVWEEGDWPSDTTIRDHFGSLNAALVELGYDPRPAGRPQGPLYVVPRTYPVGQNSLDQLLDQVRNHRDRGDLAGLKEHLFALAETAIAEADSIKTAL